MGTGVRRHPSRDRSSRSIQGVDSLSPASNHDPTITTKLPECREYNPPYTPVVPDQLKNFPRKSSVSVFSLARVLKTLQPLAAKGR